MNIALVIAGGSGSRMNQDIPKQFINVYDKPVIIYTLEKFQKHPDIDVIAVVCLDGWHEILKAYAKQFKIEKLKYVIMGGQNGQESIRNGVFELEKYYKSDDIVLVHDAIRPMVSLEIISDCIAKTRKFGSAVVSINCAEAMLKTENHMSSKEVVPRDKLIRTQTPQGFKLGNLSNVHKKAIEVGIENSVASCTLMIELGEEIYFSAGSEKNIKLTTTDDIEIFKSLLQSKKDIWLK